MSYKEKNKIEETKEIKESEDSRVDKELLIEEKIAQLYSQKHAQAIAAINIKKIERQAKKYRETLLSLKTEIKKTETEIEELKNELIN